MSRLQQRRLCNICCSFCRHQVGVFGQRCSLSADLSFMWKDLTIAVLLAGVGAEATAADHACPA